MKKKFNGFYMRGRAHYSKRLNIEDNQIMIGLYYKDGGTDGEFIIKWDQDMRYITPQLMAYQDSWKVLKYSTQLLQIMAECHDKNMAVDDLKDKLLELGYIDMTQYEDPDKTPDSDLYNCQFDSSCRCSMDKPCKGCETWAKYQEDKLK